MITSVARQCLALLLSLSILHLTVVGADRACASHGDGAAMSRTMAGHGAPGAAMHDMQASLDAGSRVAQAPRDCATPMCDRCCEAMSGCSVTTDVAMATHGALPAVDRESARGHTITLLASMRTAPEPPPPKA